ncbi:MAG: cytidylate kinase-like family protein [Gemmatimonadota bacterium]
MQNQSIDLITVSREFGAGGSDFAVELGNGLGWPVLDQDIIRRVAQRLKLQVKAVERLDEHPPNWLARVTSALLIAPPEMPVGIDTPHMLHMDSVAEAAQSVVVEAAQNPPLIIVGHSGQNIFATRPGALHVRLVAPLESRVERLMARFGWDYDTAADRARHIDADRAAYSQRYYHREWHDPLLYHVVIDTGRVSVAEAAKMIEAMAR